MLGGLWTPSKNRRPSTALGETGLSRTTAARCRHALARARVRNSYWLTPHANSSAVSDERAPASSRSAKPSPIGRHGSAKSGKAGSSAAPFPPLVPGSRSLDSHPLRHAGSATPRSRDRCRTHLRLRRGRPSTRPQLRQRHPRAGSADRPRRAVPPVATQPASRRAHRRRAPDVRHRRSARSRSRPIGRDSARRPLPAEPSTTLARREDAHAGRNQRLPGCSPGGPSAMRMPDWRFTIRAIARTACRASLASTSLGSDLSSTLRAVSVVGLGGARK